MLITLAAEEEKSKRYNKTITSFYVESMGNHSDLLNSHRNVEWRRKIVIRNFDILFLVISIYNFSNVFSFLLLYRLFEEHGDLLLLFNKFRELKTKEQQASSEELAEHANKVMETLDEGIRSLDDLDAFFEYLHQVGASHRRIPGFKAEYFWVSITQLS